MPRIKLIHIWPSLIFATLITLAGFLEIADIHGTIISFDLLWLTMPLARIGMASNIVKTDLGFWLVAGAGFALWVFLFAILFSSRWWAHFRKSWDKFWTYDKGLKP